MKTEYELFDFQSILEELRERNYANDDKKSYIEFLNAIPKDINLEDMVLYKDILSKFKVKKAFENIDLDTNFDYGTTYDYDLLQRLVFASFTSIYDLIYDEKERVIRLKISLNHKDQTVTRYLDRLWSFQILSLFKIYLNEQLELEAFYNNNEDERDAINRKRQERLSFFKKKVKQLKNKLKKNKENNENN